MPISNAPATEDLGERAINTIRTLAIDAVERANSGHPGTVMGLAPAMYALWQNDLNYDPADPLWPARDRFVLSVGHASMLLYATLFLAGVKDGEGRPALTIEDIEAFRQLDSRTPGHPEYGHTAGVETTTGPLGQGCGNSVGMAIAQKWLSARYDRPGFRLFDYRVTTFCGDGDLMEGVASEAASAAGHLGLGNLTWLYDSNSISIEGSTDIAFTEDVGRRFEAYGWHVLHVADGNDVAAITGALKAARRVTDRPTLIVLRTVIGYGAPGKAGTASAHGEPLGAAEAKGAKAAYGWPADAPDFYVPDGVQAHFAEGLGQRGALIHAAWRELLAAYRSAYPVEAVEIDALLARRLPAGWDAEIPSFPADPKGIATRASSGEVLNAVARHLPWLIGGSADLAPSTKADLKGEGSFQPERWGGTYRGRNLHFGVREHAMGAICNGLALSGLRPFGAGFLIFSDYMKAPIRLSALMRLPVTYIFTHDSIGVGEDGPTHQPIEQLAQLRATPGLTTIRPADANEVAEAWRVILARGDRPAALALSRQNLPTLDRAKYASASGVSKGGYVLACAAEDGKPEVILIATGSEVPLAVAAYEKLAAEGVKARVVSLPSFDLFEAQDRAWRDSVLPPAVTARVAVEAGSPFGWDRYAGARGEIIAMHGFGASAPAGKLLARFGFTVDAVYDAARRQISASH